MVGVLHKTTVDLIGETSTKSTDCFGFGITGSHPPLDVGPPSTRMGELGDGNPMERHVQLAIATTIESHAFRVA